MNYYFSWDFHENRGNGRDAYYGFALLFGIIIVYAAYLGIEVFARSTEILFPIFILIFIVFVVCISPQIKIENIQPIFESSTKRLFLACFNL